MNYAARHAAPEDTAWAERLICDNMAAYRAARGWLWRTEEFLEMWRHSENLVLLLDRTAVGLLRLTSNETDLHIRDVQVLPAYQRSGVGSFAVQLVERLARERALSHVRLKVFPENRACQLYRRLGFVHVGEDDAGLLMFQNM